MSTLRCCDRWHLAQWLEGPSLLAKELPATVGHGVPSYHARLESAAQLFLGTPALHDAELRSDVCCKLSCLETVALVDEGGVEHDRMTLYEQRLRLLKHLPIGGLDGLGA